MFLDGILPKAVASQKLLVTILKFCLSQKILTNFIFLNRRPYGTYSYSRSLILSIKLFLNVPCASPHKVTSWNFKISNLKTLNKRLELNFVGNDKKEKKSYKRLIIKKNKIKFGTR